jgi:hypothetical protein
MVQFSSMLRKVVALALIFQLIFAAAPAQAADPTPRKVFLVYDEISGRSAAEGIASALRSENIEVVTNPAEKPVDEDRAAKESEALVKEAKQLFRDLQFEAAISTLKRARKNATHAAYRDSFFVEALVYQTTGKSKLMSSAMENFVLLGGKSPNEAYYSPAVVRAYQDAERQVSARGAGAVTILSNTSAKSEIWLDGARIGDAPIQVSGERVGTHFLSVRALGFKRFDQLIEVRPGGVNITAQLKAFSPSMKVGVATEVRSDNARALLKMAQTETGSRGIAWIKDDTIRLFRNGEEVHFGTVQNDTVEQIKDKLLGIAPANLPRSSFAAPQTREDAAKQEKSWYQKWWVWTIVGAVALGGGAYALGAKKSSDTVSLTVGTQ